MFRIEETKDRALLDELIKDDKLANAALMDEELAALEQGLSIVDFDRHRYLVFYRGAVALGFMKFEPITNVTLGYHSYIRSEFWGLDIANKLVPLLDDWFRENTKYLKITVQTPECCREVLQFAARNGFEVEGVLTGGIFWRGKLENLILMSRFIGD